MTQQEKDKVNKLMKSQHGLIKASCEAAGVSINTYKSIMKGASNNFETLNRVMQKAREIKEKFKLSI